MHAKSPKKLYAPALVVTTLALFLFAAIASSQSALAQKIRKLPPPPPAPVFKPKPTPTPRPEELDVVRVTSNLIVVPVSVTDANGQPVLGLKQEDFRIVEEGRPQQIAQIGDPGQVPLDIAILIDVSSSVSERFAFEEQAATRFIRQVLRPVDTATIYAIDRTPRLEQTRTSADVAAAKLLTIKAATGPSPTAFYDTVTEAAHYLAANTPVGSSRNSTGESSWLFQTGKTTSVTARGIQLSRRIVRLSQKMARRRLPASAFGQLQKLLYKQGTDKRRPKSSAKSKLRTPCSIRLTRAVKAIG